MRRGEGDLPRASMSAGSLFSTVLDGADMALENFQNPPPGGSRARTRLARRSTPRSHTIFESLEREIVSGSLPPNSVLLELDLADRFGCSQSTVREALLQLQEEGLVERMAHRGTHVASCRSDDSRELLRIRHDIECRGVERAFARNDTRLREALEQDIEAMRQAAREGDVYRLSVHDRQFHLRLFDAADLPSVRPILMRCLIHNHRFKILNSQPHRGLMETAERHLAITEALKLGDPAKVRAALSHHIATIADFGPSIISPASDGMPA